MDTTATGITDLTKFIEILNKKPIIRLPKRYRAITFPTDPKSVGKLYDGLQFSFVTLWKIHLIRGSSLWKRRKKIKYLQSLPDPNGVPFLSQRSANRIYRKTKDLGNIFQTNKTKMRVYRNLIKNNYQLNGKLARQSAGAAEDTCCQNPFSPNMMMGMMFSPLKTIEDQFGPIIAMPMEIMTGYLSMLGMFSQILSSTLGLLPPVPGIVEVTETIAEISEMVHVFTNSFNMFLNIGRANWSLVIQSFIGMFPQMLELVNGVTMQLIVFNRLLKMTDEMLGMSMGTIQMVTLMITPLFQNPLAFLQMDQLPKLAMDQMKEITIPPPSIPKDLAIPEVAVGIPSPGQALADNEPTNQANIEIAPPNPTTASTGSIPATGAILES